MSELTATSLDIAVEELLRNVAQLPGELVAADLDKFRQILGLGTLTQEEFYELFIQTIDLLPSPTSPHARLLLRLDDFDKNLTKRREVAAKKYRVSKEGTARLWTERYVLAQIVYGLTQGVRKVDGQGYEVEAARFRYWFADNNPDELRIDAEFDLLVIRDDVRIFTYGSDPTGGTFYDIECLSEDFGHRFLRQVPMRATAPKGEHYAFFYLGGDVKSGTRTTVAVREFWDNADHHSIREQGVGPVSGGGPLSITLDAPRAVLSHYATFNEPYERGHRPAPQKLIERSDDNPITTLVKEPTFGYIYGFWYKIVESIR
jgi:hypothetical protein